jgi:predicted transcriptional regulator YdeE
MGINYKIILINMNYTIKTMAATNLVGVKKQILRNDDDAIEQFWQNFSQNNNFARIKNLLSPRIVALHCDYNPATNLYWFWLGGLVDEVDVDKDDLLLTKHIDELTYAIFKAKGKADIVVPEAWKRIAKEDLDRSYKCDLEIYTPVGDDLFEIEFYVSLN